MLFVKKTRLSTLLKSRENLSMTLSFKCYLIWTLPEDKSAAMKQPSWAEVKGLGVERPPPPGRQLIGDFILPVGFS